MIYLGSERIITQDYKHHVTAEDYAGSFKSPIKVNGTMKVIRVVNRFKVHEDSINYNDFLTNKSAWKDGSYYNVVTITGKKMRVLGSELGGNQVELEGIVNNQKVTYLLCHLADIFVKVGDIITSETLLATQGNTGLVLSSKSRSDITYGTHVHLEVSDAAGKYIDPRNYALGNIKPTYITNSNSKDTTVDQLKVLVDAINIREQANTSSKILDQVYINDLYTIYGTVTDSTYTWYKIKTTSGISGYIASLKTGNWLMIIPKTVVPEEKPINKDEASYTLIFKCEKTDTYALTLKAGEELYIKKPS